ncbi:MAG: cytochrome ubiquinol oxidase subunit I [Candidatus Azobacteroides sp.]|nr:cytochrome ubiquinol oxidase subunit I [Candidatus Azobacteroides sp.]
MHAIETSLIDWSRAQFALTAMYHWLFVPLTLGLGLIMAIMETIYLRTGKEFWKQTAKFWMKLFGINFAIGVATGIILEFEFGTNWSNYSWFVGDIFGTPLAIEGIMAFFMEATFIAVMFFGWNKVGKKTHLTSTWLTWGGASISALWILVANAWMQYPAGMKFNPDVVRNEMASFWEVLLSPVALNKFFHTILSGWMVGAAFVIGISCWYLMKKRNEEFAKQSIKVAAVVGVVSVVLLVYTGDGSAHQVAQKQPMKLAAMEGLYQGQKDAGLVVFGILNPDKESYDDGKDPFLFNWQVPKLLSWLAFRDSKAFVPGINDLINGGYETYDGAPTLSVDEKIQRGKTALQALSDYRVSKKTDEAQAAVHLKTLEDNYDYFGYGYISSPKQVVPPVGLTFYSFHLMVIFGAFFILLFLVVLYLTYKKDISKFKWLHIVCLISIPLAYITSQAGWIVAEVGRQPWVIQDILPTFAAVSRVSTGSVQLTFFLFLIIFTVLLIAEIGIMVKQIKKGPNLEKIKN